MIIRDAIKADIPGLRSLEQQAESAAHWPKEGYEAIFRAEAPPRLARILENNGKISAFLVASCVPGQWEIENIVVAGDMRRCGLGTRLIGDLLERARDAAVERICLEVRRSNVAARSFYLKLGFLGSGCQSNYYSNPPEDGLLFHFEVANGPVSSHSPSSHGK
jgi:ribosomal-protein-alanine N-acetyltransferase